MNNFSRVSSQWVIRMLIVGVVFAGFGLWALYDGLIYYPRRNEAIEAYQEHLEEGRMEAWSELAEEKGWPLEPDEDDYKTEMDIRIQYIMAAFCLPFGLLILIRVLIKSRQHMAVDETCFYAANGQEIPYSAIHRIDKRRWDSKAIADVFYTSESGRERKARLDAWIFSGGDEILEDLEKATGLRSEQEDGTSSDSEPSGNF